MTPPPGPGRFRRAVADVSPHARAPHGALELAVTIGDPDEGVGCRYTRAPAPAPADPRASPSGR